MAHDQAPNDQINLADQTFVEQGDPTCPVGTFGTDTFTAHNGRAPPEQTLSPVSHRIAIKG